MSINKGFDGNRFKSEAERSEHRRYVQNLAWAWVATYLLIIFLVLNYQAVWTAFLVFFVGVLVTSLVVAKPQFEQQQAVVKQGDRPAKCIWQQDSEA